MANWGGTTTYSVNGTGLGKGRWNTLGPIQGGLLRSTNRPPVSSGLTSAFPLVAPYSSGLYLNSALLLSFGLHYYTVQVGSSGYFSYPPSANTERI